MNNTIQLSVQFSIQKSLIAPADYKNIKEFYAMMIEKETEKVVLTKL